MRDVEALHRAVDAARMWLGATSPNPPVGAVALDVRGNFIAAAAHKRAGGPHAEAALIEKCHAMGRLSDVHTLAVTLEPCAHHGRTPPCCDAILAAGIKRVVVGVFDPNPHVAGGGAERLRQAGVDVVVAHDVACQTLLHAFATSVISGMPWITVKRALMADGSMVPPAGQKTFTTPSSLKLAHQLRKKADAIVTGSGTILADRPELTVRHVTDYGDKHRILAILDRRRRVGGAYIREASARGFRVMVFDDTIPMLAELDKQGVRDVLVEAGPTLSTALIAQGLWSMQVDIHHTHENNDRVDAAFNPRNAWTIDKKSFRWENFLPLESGHNDC